MTVNPNLTFLREQIKHKRIISLCGSSRSGKTYSALMFLIELCCQYSGMTISICRATLPALKSTAMKDFFDILQENSMYNENEHNKTDHTYNLYGNTIEFFSLDQPAKIRGRKRDILYINEVIPEVKLEHWRQLLLRTTGKVICDYNPSEPESWYYEQVLSREDCIELVTTYKDNPHLNADTIAEIERYKVTDPDYFRVFGQGLRGVSRVGQIFTHIQYCDVMPQGRYFYGIDFGKTNDPTAIVRLHYNSGTLWVDEIEYQTGLTASDIARVLKQHSVGASLIVADGSESLMIKELEQHGFKIKAAVKGAGSITSGISRLKSMNIFVTNRSANLKREVQWYAWKIDANGKPTNEPKDIHNHGFDALRYGIQAIDETPSKFQSFVSRTQLNLPR